MKKRILVPIIASLILGVSTTYAFANNKGLDNQSEQSTEKRRERPDSIFKQLALTDAQQQSLKELKRIYMPRKGDAKGNPKGKKNNKQFAREKSKKMRGNRLMKSPNQGKLLLAMLQEGQFDKDAAAVTAAAQVASHQFDSLMQAQFKQKVWNLLDDTQQKKFVALKEEKSKKRQERREDLGKKRTSPFEKLELSEQQTGEIASIDEKLKAKKEALKSDIKTFKEAEKRLVQSNTFDHKAWAKLWKKHEKAVIKDKVAIAKIHFDKLQVLTPDQQEQLKKMLKKGRKGKGKKSKQKEA